jgi:hypothetical protein
MKSIIRKILKEHLNEVRVPRKDRIQLYKDNNIIVIVPLTHDALRKYATNCLWCINSDRQEWVLREGQSVLIIQRNPIPVRIGISGVPTNEEIYAFKRWEEGRYSKKDIENILDYEFSSEDNLKYYYDQLTSNISNFDMNTVFHSRGEGTIDKGNNYLSDYGFGLRQVPHINDEAINTINKYLRESYQKFY